MEYSKYNKGLLEIHEYLDFYTCNLDGPCLARPVKCGANRKVAYYAKYP